MNKFKLGFYSAFLKYPKLDWLLFLALSGLNMDMMLPLKLPLGVLFEMRFVFKMLK